MSRPPMTVNGFQCFVFLSEDPEYFVAEICAGMYGDIACTARDPLMAEALAWRELSDRQIQRTRTTAYREVRDIYIREMRFK